MLMILNVLRTITALSITLGAIAERSLRRRIAVEATDAALVNGGLTSFFSSGLVRATALCLLQVSPMIAAEKYQVVEHGGDNQQSLHPVADDYAITQTYPHQEGKPFDLDWQDKENVDNEFWE
jgi:hypothetical protein